jgi:hypothetical protein
MAGLDPGLSAHGIRKCGAVRCVEAGATGHQLMALFGWETTKQTSTYTRKANHVRLEAGAAPVLLGAQTGNKKRAISGKNGPLFPAVASGGPIRPE